MSTLSSSFQRRTLGFLNFLYCFFSVLNYTDSCFCLYFLLPSPFFGLIYFSFIQFLKTESLEEKKQFFFYSSVSWAFLVAQMVKYLLAMWETKVRSLFQEDPLEKGMALHSSILAGEFHGQRSLVSYNPWGHKEFDMTEWLIHLLFNCWVLAKIPVIEDRWVKKKFCFLTCVPHVRHLGKNESNSKK